MEKCKGISVIIPTLNEEDFIQNLIRHLKFYGMNDLEVIVSDGGSTDSTISIAEEEGAKVVRCKTKGRAAQMNYGASFASKSILYFVHADCVPPINFNSKILEAIAYGYDLGRFQTKFNSNNLLLKLNAFFTRFNWFVCNGGDQTLFFKKNLFLKISGYNADFSIMEDFDIVQRARQRFRYIILRDKVLVSARKYNKNSWLTVQKANYIIIKMYRRGAKQDAMFEKYKQLLTYRYE